MSDEDLVLEALPTLPFPVGKKLLVDILIGNANNESIQRNKLNELECFGVLSYTQEEASGLLTSMLASGIITQEPMEGKPFLKVLKPAKSMKNPYEKSKITEEERILFKEFEFFLGKYDDEQKKAIISPKKQILCIAGAGSGKTSTLTKRIEFLLQFKGVSPKKILAITFTRKAKEELESRLSNAPIHIETFNSFCEQLLRRHASIAYDKPVSVISFSEKIKLVQMALKDQKKSIDEAVELYFSKAQLRQRTQEKLRLSFVNECFSILDLFKNANAPLDDFSDQCTDRIAAKMMFEVATFIEGKMKELGKRDFADQLIDTINLFQNFPETIPAYDHILVDEYQDVNAIQTLLLDILNPQNLFCVGDPRQSIYGWRGSRIKYILSFKEKFPESEVITLTTNYRSHEKIVTTSNTLIQSLRLPELSASKNLPANMSIVEFNKEEEEIKHLCDEASKNQELFIIARTNKSLVKLSDALRRESISHILKNDEEERAIGTTPKLTLSTVHAVKGLEADNVIIMQCNSANFPCKASDHPIIDAIRFEDYDRQAEELRLLYVALTRARKNITITYVGNISPFILTSVRKNFSVVRTKKDVYTLLREWRNELSEQQKIPAYFIMHDSTLQSIASQKPSSLFELEQIGGLGPVKLQKYGNTILNILMGMR